MKFPYPGSIGQRWLLALLFCLAPLLAAAPALADSPKRPEPPESILFVGNSFTFYNNSIYTYLRRLLMAEDPSTRETILLKSMTISGAVLADHEGGLGQMLELRPWDVVVLQGHSREAIEPERRPGLDDAAGRFVETIRDRGARPVLFMTWAYADQPEMAPKLDQAYTELGRKLDVMVIPVGLAFADALAGRPDLALHVADKVHPTVAGTYLAGSVFYAALYGKDPGPLDFDAGLDPGDAAFLRRIAWQTVNRYYHGQ